MKTYLKSVLKYSAYALAMMCSFSTAHATQIQVLFTDSQMAVIFVLDDGSIIYGTSNANSDYAVINLKHAPDDLITTQSVSTDEAVGGTGGSGFVGGNSPVVEEDSNSTDPAGNARSWGSAEIALNCFSADIILRQHGEPSSAQGNSDQSNEVLVTNIPTSRC